MVCIKDFRKEFHDVILNQNILGIQVQDDPADERVLMLVSLDVDALSACKILQYLFQCDHVLYTIVPVAGSQDLERAFMENSEGIQHVVLINCGGCIDIVEALQPDDNIVFYIADSHRPIDVHNIYNQVQVKLLMKAEELEDVPEFDQVFREDEEEDDSGNESDGVEPSGKRKRFDEQSLEKKRQRRLWEERKQKILFEYSEFSGYGSSSAFLMYELAWKMSKDTNDILWLGILGVTDQYIHNKIDRDKYIEDVGNLQSHVSRLNHRPDDEENQISVDSLKISFEQELQLTLYRHWSIYESLWHTSAMACKFRVWTMKGKKRLHEFLADMGLPLVQCKQKFASMDIQLKESVKDMISQQADKYSLREQDIFLPSFVAQYGFRNRLCAADNVLSCEALLEAVDKEKSASDNFLQALDVLNRSNTEVLSKSTEMAKLQLKAIVNQVQSFLDMGLVISAGPFLYAFAQDGTPDVMFFSKPICIQKLARFTLEAYCSVTKSKKAVQLPLVLGAPMDRERGTMLIVGVPPASENTCKNFFGKAFEQAAISTHSRTIQDSFNTNIIEIKTEDKSKFFDALISLLQ